MKKLHCSLIKVILAFCCMLPVSLSSDDLTAAATSFLNTDAAYVVIGVFAFIFFFFSGLYDLFCWFFSFIKEIKSSKFEQPNDFEDPAEPVK